MHEQTITTEQSFVCVKIVFRAYMRKRKKSFDQVHQ